MGTANGERPTAKGIDMRSVRNVLIILTSFMTSDLHAQEEMATDRPDQTEASSTVGQGVLQVETGVVFSKVTYPQFNGGSSTEKVRDYGTTLIRYGVFDNIELRLATALTDYPFGMFARITGLNPLAMGVKIDIHPEQGLRPELAFIGHLTFPWIGDENLVPEYVASDFRFSLSHTLSDRFSLGYNVGMAWDGVNPQGSFLYTIALGAGITGPVSGFVELFGEIPEEGNFAHNADIGLTMLLNPDLQLDASYGFNLYNRDVSKTQFLNAGISARFGNEP